MLPVGGAGAATPVGGLTPGLGAVGGGAGGTPVGGIPACLQSALPAGLLVLLGLPPSMSATDLMGVTLTQTTIQGLDLIWKPETGGCGW